MTPQEQFDKLFEESTIKNIGLSTLSPKTLKRALQFFYEQGRSDRFEELNEAYYFENKGGV